VIGALHEITPDGYVFRVDMRLRPYGESGPLAVPYSALEQYLITQGRAWERYAWLKARALTGDRHDELYALVTPFVFRKYLDFDAYDGLRDIHRQIAEQGRRNDYAHNVKLGPGGIREIEFIVQALQLVRGGRELDLRPWNALALAVLAERPSAGGGDHRVAAGLCLPAQARASLQYRDDRQTQMLPADAAEREALARMGAPSVAEFGPRPRAPRRVSAQFSGLSALRAHRRVVDGNVRHAIRCRRRFHAADARRCLGRRRRCGRARATLCSRVRRSRRPSRI
jgi:glutamate-ammonia-ligase adenylyltransferase